MKKTIKIVNRICLYMILITIIITSYDYTFAKFVSKKSSSLGYNLVGEKYNDDGLIDSDMSYVGSRELLANPYRGCYELDSLKLEAYDEENDEINEKNKQNLLDHGISRTEDIIEKKESLGLVLVYLDNYKETATLPQFYLEALDEYLDIYRKAGLKAVVRFAYGQDYAEGEDRENDPSDFNIVLGHVEQLKEFFETNKDVIHVVQLGFIGPWGEMHSSVYAEKQYINQLIDKALQVVPYPIQIAVRRPRYYREYIGENAFFDAKLAGTEDKRARLTLFNDAYLSSKTDKGTYEEGQRESELEWQSYLTKYTVSGGEISFSKPPYVDSDDTFFEIDEALLDMKSVNMNYLHDGNSHIFNYWKEEATVSEEVDPNYVGLDGYTYLCNKMGYRYLVTNAKVPGYEVQKGGTLNFETTILNEGVANLIQERKVYVLLAKDNKYYKAVTDKDPTKWWSGESTKEEFVLKLPSDIQEGEWKIYLSLPDSFETYEDNEYASIRFANEDCYLKQIQGNYIGTITIKGESDNTNNGFYQLNDADTSIETTAELHDYARPIQLDGLITDKYEWADADLIYDDGITEVYLREDDENFYLIGGKYGYEAKDYHIQVSIATQKSSSSKKYQYMTEDSSIYDGSNKNSTSDLDNNNKTKVNYVSDQYFEYKIPKDRIKAYSKEDIKELRIDYVSHDWHSVFHFEITDFNVSHAITLDGFNTNEEWREENIILEDENTKIYATIDEPYIYIYVDTNQSLKNNNYYLYIAGKSASGKRDYNRELLLGNITDDSEDIVGAYRSIIENGIEYKINMEQIDVSEITDIQGLAFALKDKTTQEEKYRAEAKLEEYIIDITVDGIKSSSEWKEEWLVGSNDKMKLYAVIGNGNLYIYGEFLKGLPEAGYTNLQLHFATKDTTSRSSYNYMVENSSIYSMVSGNPSEIDNVTNERLTNSFEYAIPIKLMGINSINDIMSIKVEPLENWSEIYSVNICDVKNHIIVDGKKSATEKWTESDLIGSQDGVDLYIKKVGNDILYYINYNEDELSQPVMKYSLTFYIGDKRLAKMENGKLYLRDEANSSWGSSVATLINVKDEGIEGIINEEDLNFNLEDVTSYRISLMDNDYGSITEVTMKCKETSNVMNMLKRGKYENKNTFLSSYLTKMT